MDETDNSGYDNSGYHNSGNYNSGNANSGHDNSGNYNSGNANSGNYNSGNANSGHDNSGHANSGQDNSGNYNSGNYNSGNYNSGYHNSGNYNSGHFNDGEPTILMFGKVTGKNRSEIIIPYIDLKLNEWIAESTMSDQEKKANPKFFVVKGYLKTIPYKDAWKVWWKNATKGQKEEIKNLPNFDEVIFYNITGIEVACDQDKLKKDLMAEAEKLLKAGQELLNKAKSL